MAIKIVVADPKLGKAKQFEVGDDMARELNGKRLGHTVTGKEVGLDEGYTFVITGGTDNAGFPMRRDINAPGRHKIFAVKGVGLKPTRDGMRKRKTVSGAIINNQTAQLNLKIDKYGKTPLFEEPKTEEPAQEEPKAEQ